MAIKEVSERYLELRQNALDYTFEQMNLQLENDKQVYLAVFDIPVESAIIGNKTKTLVLVFGLNRIFPKYNQTSSFFLLFRPPAL